MYAYINIYIYICIYIYIYVYIYIIRQAAVGQVVRLINISMTAAAILRNGGLAIKFPVDPFLERADAASSITRLN